MTEQKLIKLEIDDIKEIIAEHFNTHVLNVELSSYHYSNDFGDVYEGIRCSVRVVEE